MPHTRELAAALLVAFAALAVAGAVSAAPPASGPHVEDPEGDAWEYGREMTAGKRRGVCGLATAAQAACESAQDGVDLGNGPPDGAFPAPPALDGIAAWFEETSTHLLVRLQVASLPPDLEGVVGEDAFGPYVTGYQLTWSVGGACSEMVWIDVHAVGVVDAAYDAWELCDAPADHPWGGGCNSWWWCSYGVETEFTYGTPGVLTWKVPRDLLLDDARGVELGDLAFEIHRHRPAELDAQYAVYAQHRPTLAEGTYEAQGRYVVDGSGTGRPFALAGSRAPEPPAVPSTLWRHPSGSTPDPQTDLLGVEIAETPETLEFTIELASLAPDKDGAGLWIGIGLPTGHEVSMGATPTASGDWQAYAVMGMPYYDQPAEDRELVALQTEVVVTEGAPGMMRFSLDRTQLPPIAKGDRTSLVWVAALKGVVHHHNHGLPTYPALDPTVSASGGPFPSHEERIVAPAYAFRFDTSKKALAAIVRLDDPSGDATLPAAAAADGTRPEQFDITYVQLRDRPDGTLELTAGVRDLSVVTVPLGYHAVYYGLGLEDRAGTFMVGYYKDNNDPGGTFLCAQDTAFLAEAPRDPTQAVWTVIDGVLTAAPSDHSGSGGLGSFTFYVPRGCLGLDEGEEVAFSRLNAASFLIRNPTARNGQGQLEMVDEAASNGAIVLPLAVEEEIQAAWYVQPFGVSNFWDIAGIAFAAFATVVAGGVKLAHRRRDKRAVAAAKLHEDRDVYKAALAKAVARGATDPDKDEVLGALRRRLGIGEREHALMLLQARTAAGLAVSLAPGDRFLGRYLVERTLGEGGFARTFLAHDEKLGRRVVLKVARWDDPREAERALKEARILADLAHARIVQIHDVEEVSGQLILVLEHMPRGSLADVLARGSVTPAEAIAVADDVLWALEAAHAAGVVHRDVKPSNILLAADGSARLADFGIARAEAGSGTASGASLDGAGAGTVRYMAPEQARGAGARPQSDLYAMGIVLYEALTGRCYLDLDGLGDLEARNAIVSDSPLLPVAGVSPEMNALLARALAKDPSKRPASAAEMRRMLQRAG